MGEISLCNKTLLAKIRIWGYSEREVNNMSKVSSNIKKFRKEKDMTQDVLAEKLCVTRQAVSNWENDKTQPDVDTLEKLAEVFEVSVEELIYGEKGKTVIDKTIKLGGDGIGFGCALAAIISYVHWHSIGWAILHGALGWIYVIYYAIKF